MVSPWVKVCSKFSLKNKMEVAHPSKLIKKNELIYYKKDSDTSSTSTSDLPDSCTPMSYKDTIYLGIVPMDEALPKTGYGHFYLYHPYNKDVNDIKELEDSLKLFAIVKTSPDVGLHIPIVKKVGYTTGCTSIKNYYALGSFDNNKRTFESIDKLMDYYKKINPSQIIKENKEIIKSDTSLICEILKQPVDENNEGNGEKKNILKNMCDEIEKTIEVNSEDPFNDTTLPHNEKNKKGILCKGLPPKCGNVKEITDSQKWNCIKDLRNQKFSEDELKSSSTLATTSFKSFDPSTTLVEKFDINKKEKVEKLIRDDDFYNSYYLGDLRKKEAGKGVKKPFDFAFYHREYKKKHKNKKKLMYLVYKPIKGKPIHLPITRKRNRNYDGSEKSVKRFYLVKTPYGTHEQFNNFKEIVDYYYDRIEKVKELYQIFIR